MRKVKNRIFFNFIVIFVIALIFISCDSYKNDPEIGKAEKYANYYWVKDLPKEAQEAIVQVVRQYGELNTSIGSVEFEFHVYYNDEIYSPYDYQLEVEWDYDFIHDLKYKNRISTETNLLVCQELKQHQENLAHCFINALPGKKVQGSYFRSGWKYPSIHEGFWYDETYSWKNWDSLNSFCFRYSDSYVSEFQWTPESDNYSFKR